MAVMLLAGSSRAQSYPGQPTGPGGGGAIYAPVVAPYDASIAFVACDMTALYRSVNIDSVNTATGAQWTMLDNRHAQISYTRDGVHLALPGEGDPNRPGNPDMNPLARYQFSVAIDPSVKPATKGSVQGIHIVAWNASTNNLEESSNGGDTWTPYRLPIGEAVTATTTLAQGECCAA
jgi:hypothetical protein